MLHIEAFFSLMDCFLVLCVARSREIGRNTSPSRSPHSIWPWWCQGPKTKGPVLQPLNQPPISLHGILDQDHVFTNIILLSDYYQRSWQCFSFCVKLPQKTASLTDLSKYIWQGKAALCSSENTHLPHCTHTNNFILFTDRHYWTPHVLKQSRFSL